MSELEQVPRAPHYLKIRKGVYKTSYWIVYRGDGLDLREALEGDFSSWKDALREADRKIAEARFGNKATPKELIRNEEIIDQLLAETGGQDKATQAIKKNIFLKHLKPWFNENAPYASMLNVATWPAYKTFKRSERATIALENHYKYFSMLARRVWQLGIVQAKIEIKFNVKKEDFRKQGMVISDEHLAMILAAATPKHFGKLERVQPKWRDRIVLQRRTGLRPGEARDLEKSRVTFGTDGLGRYAVIDIPPEKAKTHIGRKFKVRHPDVLELLERRMMRIPGPYFFPNEKNSSKPMDKSLKGWHAIIQRAFDPSCSGIDLPDYTPHDLRHTYATEMFKKTNKYAQLCYQLNMSLEVAQETYIHLNENDTEELADLAAQTRAA